jgi:hypothetical protein
MEKRARERAVKERRERKEEKRRARKLAASGEANPEAVDADAEGDNSEEVDAEPEIADS